jgi:hypothetical protein
MTADTPPAGPVPSETPTPVPPETKDWTWVLDRPCPECGLDTRTVGPAELPGALRAVSADWDQALDAPAELLRERPAPAVWSPLEYACHVRDVYRVFGGRLELMLADDGARFAGWDQDEAAVAQRYAAQDPATVRIELAEAGRAVAAAFEAVPAARWGHTGLRGDGTRFTVATLGRYLLHDVVHHLHDVRAQRR